MKIQNENGRTMLEMLGVISIMGIITYGAIAGINYGMTSYKINQMYTEVQDIIQGIEDLYSWTKNGYPDSNSIMRAADDNDIFSGAVGPCTGAGVEGNCAKGSFGDIKIDQIEDGESFAVTYYSIPIDNCSRITQMDWNSFSVDFCINNINPNDCSGACPPAGSTFNILFKPKSD